jgi:hypothetical protein
MDSAVDTGIPVIRGDSIFVPVFLRADHIFGLDMVVRIDAREAVSVDVHPALEDGDVSLNAMAKGRHRVRFGMYSVDPLPSDRICWIACTMPDEGRPFSVFLEDIFLNDVSYEDMAFRIDPGSVQNRPADLTLFCNFPNPFNASTSIRYRLGGRSHVQIDLFNISGRKIATLLDREQEPGTYDLVWDGRDDDGRDCVSGHYLVLFRSGGSRRSLRMELVK